MGGGQVVSVGGLIEVLVAVLGGGLFTALVAYLRYRNTGTAERESIVVESSERALKMMGDVLKQRQEDLSAALVRIEELEQRIQETSRLIDQLQIELGEEREARAEVQERLTSAIRERDAMREELRQLRAQVNRIDPEVKSNGGGSAAASVSASP